jgi:SAM-dependent methyltransferase
VRQRHDKGPLTGSAARIRTGAAAWLARAGLVARAGFDTTARRVRTFSFRPVSSRLSPTAQPDAELGSRPYLYLSVGLVAGAVIALQIAIMRLFSVGSWAHFGSLVVSLAMLGFGLTSAIMCVRKDWFARHWRGVAMAALVLFGPLAVVANLVAQQIPFNAIFLVSDPTQKWRLFANFLLYMLPFLAGAFYLGTVFLKAQRLFGRVYFADLTGSGLCGLLFLGAMYLLVPENLLLVPLVLWCAGSVLWFMAVDTPRSAAWVSAVAIVCGVVQLAAPTFGLATLSVSDYKGVSYARKFPDSERVYERASPFGYLEVYSSSYLHFAPGLSDNAAFNLPAMPANAYLGLYIDGEGPSGVIRDLPQAETGYFRYLPMIYPYLIKRAPDTFVVQFGGGISTAVALKSGSKSVTVAEGNPAVLAAFRNDKRLREFTGDVLRSPKLKVIDYEGRLYLAHTDNRFDIIDLSLADSAGLSSPGGFAIVEKFAYAREAMTSYMRALKPGGVLSVTLWNKEEPPKSVLKLYATMAAAARQVDGDNIADRFFVVSSYLSTATVLYKRNGFTPNETAKLRAHTRAMSFDEIYSPGFAFEEKDAATVLQEYRNSIFPDGPTPDPAAANDAPQPGEGPPPENDTLPATTMGQMAWHHLVYGGWDDMAGRYVFDTRPLSNDRPYFAAYVKPVDLPRVTDRLELLQDEWGFLLVWATLGIACIAALSLVLLPLAFGWRTIFSRNPGKLRTIIYFACLGAGYIMVEVGLISKFIQALSNATVSASVLITGMLVCSGAGSLASERCIDRARSIMPRIFTAIGLLLIGYGLALDSVLDWIGTFPYALRLFFCFALVFPPAFLMGFPMPIAMTWLARQGKDHMFLWAWGINGCFSVVGAALVPVIATSFGLGAVLMASGCAYLLAILPFFAVLLPLASAPARAVG